MHFRSLLPWDAEFFTVYVHCILIWMVVEDRLTTFCIWSFHNLFHFSLSVTIFLSWFFQGKINVTRSYIVLRKLTRLSRLSLSVFSPQVILEEIPNDFLVSSALISYAEVLMKPSSCNCPKTSMMCSTSHI